MNRDRLDRILREAVTAGILPDGAALAPEDTRPWPLALMIALGAWLAAIPLFAAAYLILEKTFHTGIGPYVLASVLLLGAIVVLRRDDLPPFVEQLAVPVLLVGVGLLATGLFRDMPNDWAAASLALVAVLGAWSLPQPWLRALLGAVAAPLTVLAVAPHGWFVPGRSGRTGLWLGLHTCLALWLAAHMIERHSSRRHAPLEALSAGWLLATLAGLALWSGMSFLVGGGMGQVARDLGELLLSSPLSWQGGAAQPVSVALAAGAAWWIGGRWPTLRKWPGGLPAAGLVVVALGMAWCRPSLGAVLLALAFCAGSARWRLAGGAALAAAWIIGGFYYELRWPLAEKAALLAASGSALGALAWLALRRDRLAALPARAAGAPAPAARVMPAGVAVCALVVLAVANSVIWQKENVIAHGQAVYIELAPVDPRSLMQGDYMRLNYMMPFKLSEDGNGFPRRPLVVARRDARGIATLLRPDQGGPRATDEFLLELTHKNGRWTVASDAWFFKEGEGARWAGAKYGEFRVDKNGHALLVGLRGPDLEKLGPER